MKSWIRLFTLVLCLGIFILPKQVFASSAQTEQCCVKDDSQACCKTEKHHKDSTKDDCQNQSHCCNSCHSPNFSFFTKNHSEFSPTSGFLGTPFSNFKYSTPYFSSLLKEIWQPPKIA